MRGLSRATRGRILLGDVIVAIDGETVRNEDDLASIIEQRQPGDTVLVRTVRDNRLHEYEVELLAPPNQ
jgi:S1-C subfamily serine protease